MKNKDIHSIIKKAQKLGFEGNRTHLNKAAHGSWRNQLSYVFGLPIVYSSLTWFASTYMAVVMWSGGLAAMLASGAFLVTIASIIAVSILGFLIASGWNAWNLSCERARIHTENEDTPSPENEVNALRQSIDNDVDKCCVPIDEAHTSAWLQRYSKEILGNIDDATVLSDYVYLMNYKRYQQGKHAQIGGWSSIFSKPVFHRVYGWSHKYNEDWKERYITELKGYCRNECKRLQRVRTDKELSGMVNSSSSSTRQGVCSRGQTVAAPPSYDSLFGSSPSDGAGSAIASHSLLASLRSSHAVAEGSVNETHLPIVAGSDVAQPVVVGVRLP